MSDEEVRGQRCRRCGHRFAVMADEADMHACPRCGYHPEGSTDDREEPEC